MEYLISSIAVESVSTEIVLISKLMPIACAADLKVIQPEFSLIYDVEPQLEGL